MRERVRGWLRHRAVHLTVAWLLVGAAVTVNNCASPTALPLVLVATWLVVRVAAGRGAIGPVPRGALAAAIIVAALVGQVHPPGLHLLPGATRLWSIIGLGAIALACLAALRRPSLARWLLASLVVLYLALGAWLLAASPSPRIDVFIFEQHGARALLDGQNPYTVTFPNPYDARESVLFHGAAPARLAAYPYPPLSLVATTLGYLVAGDARVAMLVAQLASALLLWWIARRSDHRPEVALALAGLHLLHPRGLFVLEQAWTEPLVGALWLGVMALLPTARPLATGGVIGLWLAMKQYGVIVLPLLAFAKRWRRPSMWLVAALVGAAVTAPFWLWDRAGFVDDVLLFQLRQPFRMDTLSLPPLVARLTGWRAPGALAVLAALGAIAWLWQQHRRHRLPPTSHGAAVGMALVYLAFFLAAKQAFCNYYYLVGTLLLGAVASAPVPSGDAAADAASRHAPC